MKRSDATVLVVVGVVAVIAAFWFAVLAPKRSKVSDLDSQVTSLQGQVTQQRQIVDSALAARSTFAADYKRLVVLGKAVPADSEQASLLVQLNTLADRSGVQFQSLDLNQDSGAATAPPPATTTTTTPTTTSTDTSTTSTTTTGTSTTATTASSTAATTATAAPSATEETAATMPLGAGIGPAGLPVMPYNLTFTGGYFQIATFLHRLDSLVHTAHDDIRVGGRLLTVNGFDLSPVDTSGSTTASSTGLQATLSVTTFLSPANGTTAGASPSGPAPTTPSTAVPASSTTPTTTPAPTTTTPAPTTPATPTSTQVASTP